MEMTTPTPETLTPDEADKLMTSGGFCIFCEVDLNLGRGHGDWCKWPVIRAAWEASLTRADGAIYLGKPTAFWMRKAFVEGYSKGAERAELRLTEAETTAKNYLASHTKALADDDPTGTCAANHRGYIECAKAVLAALAHDKEG